MVKKDISDSRKWDLFLGKFGEYKISTQDAIELAIVIGLLMIGLIYALQSIPTVGFNNSSLNLSANCTILTDFFTGDGEITIFTLSNIKLLDSEAVFLNGVRQKQNNGSYTTTSTTINFTSAPPLNDEIGVQYVKD